MRQLLEPVSQSNKALIGLVETVREGLISYEVAERVGFEPTAPETGATVFETVAFNRSAISPLSS